MVTSIKSKSVRIARILAGGALSWTKCGPSPEFPVLARKNIQSRIVPTAIANSFMTASPKRSICFWHSAGLDFRGFPTREGIMQTTRRTFLGAVGATAALGMAGGARLSEALAAEPRVANVPAASGEKVLFWVAASTPCDKNLKFDEELYMDLLAYLKSNGADGVVVLGTTGEFPSFSVAERKQVAETRS